MNEVIPGINETEWSEIEKKIELVLPFAKTIHIDLMDGVFVERKTFSDPSPYTKYTDQAVFELHMMVDNPVQYLKPWADVGFQRFIGHIEKMPDIIEFVAQGQLLGAVGLAIDGPTNLDVLKNINLNDLDCLLIMTIKAGLSGQKFQPELLTKVKKIREKYPYLPIEVDGGINDTTIIETCLAGATRFVSTSHLFKSPNIEEEYKNLTSQLNNPNL